MTPDVEGSLEISQEWLKENTKRYAFKKLEREIIKTEVCVECGLCVANCPVDAITGERVDNKYVPQLTGKCTSCGICYAMCPRTKILPEQLLGEYKTIWRAKRTTEGGKRQDGGVATALMAAGLRKKSLDAAVVAIQGENPWLPETLIATTEEDVLGSGGTIYTHTPIVAGMMKAFREGDSKVAVVGTACNLDAITRLQIHTAGYLSVDKDADVTKLGLFCMESFDYDRLKTYLKDNGIDIQKVTRMAIAGGKFTVSDGDEQHEWPVKDLDVAAAKSCSYCHDLTAKNADISCGNIGSDEGYTTVIVRTDKGEKFLLQCVKEGLIEAEPLEEKAIRIIGNVARSKATKYYKMKPVH
ncbi:MAG: Coenzyme F420 hydrogenase/dehydrogenase, beta subunit C-terminal domain [Candidatus Thorarchaeota archaeon]|nr:Coenzyme F420 hydrogenase/dehydrogenase, beta subunit C-terminal domain [Candidatus Thorarchaeota archaeon]